MLFIYIFTEHSLTILSIWELFMLKNVIINAKYKRITFDAY